MVITVPITVLRDGDISFMPPLPQAKIQAARNICMEPVYKIICRFQTVFWPHDLGIMTCCDGFVSHIHQDCRYERYSSSSTQLAVDTSVKKMSRKENLDSSGCFMLSGFQTSGPAAEKEGLSGEEMVKGFLRQLDEIFG